MTYSGSEFDIGGHTFKLSGGGTFNNTNNLILDNSGSKLAVSDSTKISHLLVSASNTNGGMTISSSGSYSAVNIVENITLSSSFYVSSDVAWAVENIIVDTALIFSNDKDVNVGTMTSSPGDTPDILKLTCRAAVPLIHATANSLPVNLAILSSKTSTYLPAVDTQVDSIQSLT